MPKVELNEHQTQVLKKMYEDILKLTNQLQKEENQKKIENIVDHLKQMEKNLTDQISNFSKKKNVVDSAAVEKITQDLEKLSDLVKKYDTSFGKVQKVGVRIAAPGSTGKDQSSFRNKMNIQVMKILASANALEKEPKFTFFTKLGQAATKSMNAIKKVFGLGKKPSITPGLSKETQSAMTDKRQQDLTKAMKEGLKPEEKQPTTKVPKPGKG